MRDIRNAPRRRESAKEDAKKKGLVVCNLLDLLRGAFVDWRVIGHAAKKIQLVRLNHVVLNSGGLHAEPRMKKVDDFGNDCLGHLFSFFGSCQQRISP